MHDFAMGDALDGDASTSLDSLTYYDIYMHNEHPLKGNWIKLTAKLVEKLHVPDGWEASHPGIKESGAAPANVATSFPLYHYLNHPLPYVQVCGIVIDIHYVEIASPMWQFQLDDSSGTIIHAMFKKVADPTVPTRSRYNNNVQPKEIQYVGPGEAIPAPVPQWRCCGWLGPTALDIRPIRTGCVLRVKGRINPSNFGHQILVEQFNVFHSTSEEIQFWESMNRDFEEILKVPWYMSQKQCAKLKFDFDQASEEREKRARRIERRARHERKKQQQRELAARTVNNQPAGHEDEQTRDEDHANAESNDASVGEPPANLPSSTSNHPVRAGLAPSYQVPQRSSNSTTSSTEQTSVKASSNGSSSGQTDIGPTSMPERFKAAFEHTKDSFLDTGLPSMRKVMEHNLEAKPTRLMTGTEWIQLRNDILKKREASSMVDENDLASAQGRIVGKLSSESKFGSLTLEQPERVIAGSEWLELRSKLDGQHALDASMWMSSSTKQRQSISKKNG